MLMLRMYVPMPEIATGPMAERSSERVMFTDGMWYFSIYVVSGTSVSKR